MFSKVLNSVENFSNCYCCKSLLTFGSVCCSKLVFKNYYQNFHSGPSFSVNVKNYSHWGPLTQYRNTVGYQCSGSAVPLGCRNRENDKGKAKITRFAAVTAPWPSACCSKSFQNSDVTHLWYLCVQMPHVCSCQAWFATCLFMLVMFCIGSFWA